MPKPPEQTLQPSPCEINSVTRCWESYSRNTSAYGATVVLLAESTADWLPPSKASKRLVRGVRENVFQAVRVAGRAIGRVVAVVAGVDDVAAAIFDLGKHQVARVAVGRVVGAVVVAVIGLLHGRPVRPAVGRLAERYAGNEAGVHAACNVRVDIRIDGARGADRGEPDFQRLAGAVGAGDLRDVAGRVGNARQLALLAGRHRTAEIVEAERVAGLVDEYQLVRRGVGGERVLEEVFFLILAIDEVERARQRALGENDGVGVRLDQLRHA